MSKKKRFPQSAHQAMSEVAKRAARLSSCLVLMLVLTVLVPSAEAQTLIWQTSKQAALDLAVQQGKMILLVAGRDT